MDSSSRRSLDYFSQLTKAQVVELYNIYRMDFELFSYSPDTFIHTAKGQLEKEKLSKLRNFSKTSDNPFVYLGKIFKKSIEMKKANKELSGGETLEERKSLQFLERAKQKQELQIKYFNKQFGST